jgi:alkylhydroperoxidase/carboxymuconolactone decarboxylase family protein YurZ
MSMDIFKKEAPEVVDAYFNLIKTLERRCPLESKVKELVLIGILTAKQSPEGLPIHIERARQNGATESEILTVIISALPSCGMGTVLNSLKIAKEIMKL